MEKNVLDHNLARDILAWMSNESATRKIQPEFIEELKASYSEDDEGELDREVNRNLGILETARLVHPGHAGLTEQGLRYFDMIQDDDVWSEIQKRAERASRSLSFNFIQAAADQLSLEASRGL